MRDRPRHLTACVMDVRGAFHEHPCELPWALTAFHEMFHDIFHEHTTMVYMPCSKKEVEHRQISHLMLITQRQIAQGCSHVAEGCSLAWVVGVAGVPLVDLDRTQQQRSCLVVLALELSLVGFRHVKTTSVPFRFIYTDSSS